MENNNEAPCLSTIMASFDLAETTNHDTTDLHENVKVLRGMKAELLNLYPGPSVCSCCTNWVKEYPDDVQEAVEATEITQQYAILLRNKKSHGKRATKPLELDSIVVYSPLIKKVLDEKVFRDYPGVTSTLDKVEFSAPFAPFLHRWSEFENAYLNEDDYQIKSHLALIYDAISKDIKDVSETAKDMVSKGVITYDLLWTIFKAGDMIYSPVLESLFRLKASQTTEKEFKIVMESISSDGERLGYETISGSIPAMSGTVHIRTLPIYPLEYNVDPEAIKAACRTRGQKFVDLRGTHHRMLRRSGKSTFDIPGMNTILELRVNERIMIDAKTYFEHTTNQNDQMLFLTPLRDKNVSVAEERQLTEEEFLLCSCVVRGFSFITKRWSLFPVDWIEDMMWNDDVFNNLVLSEDRKDLVLGFVECHRGMDEGFDDFVEGKGRSLIFLLSGPPGVGKTLTAEGVAEKLHAPLYSVSAGELGVEVSEVESKLQVVLDVAQRWEAVLLLDEADVFLEQRTISDLQRNRLVSVFLRKLEYYEGVMFLTTNRYQQIDRAFQSRIDMHLQYSELDEDSRFAIWRNFVLHSKKSVDISEGDLRALSATAANGRQIKSVIKQAFLLAARSGESCLRVEHIRRILQISVTDAVNPL